MVQGGEADRVLAASLPTRLQKQQLNNNRPEPIIPGLFFSYYIQICKINSFRRGAGVGVIIVVKMSV
jgi:hypothetical protein